MSKSLFTNSWSKHLTGVLTVAAAAVVVLENTALPSSVYEVIPEAARAHPVNDALLYPVPAWVTVKPVISFKPISADASAEGGAWIIIEGGAAAV